jgi:hypothetical protein
LLWANNFSRQHTLRFRIEEAKKELRKLNAHMQPQASVQPSWDAEKIDICEHIKTAEKNLDNADGNGALETVLRHVMAAERKLISFFPDKRMTGAIADLQRDLVTYVPAERHPELAKLLEEAGTAPAQGKIWQEPLLAAKVQIDEIVIRGYQMRERLGEGIKVLGVFLGVIDVALLVCIAIVNRDSANSLFAVDNMSGSLAMLIGAFFGGVGACLSGLMNFTVHRIARGEFETFASTVIRPLIGVTSGMLGVVLAASGILNFNGEKIFPGLAITAFILGFSERLVMGTVERLSTRAEARISSAQ